MFSQSKTKEMKAIKIEHCAECIFKDHSIHSYPDGHEKRYCVREDGLALLKDWPHIPSDCPLDDHVPDAGKMVDHSGDINKMIEKAEKKAALAAWIAARSRYVGYTSSIEIAVKQAFEKWYDQWKEAGNGK